MVEEIATAFYSFSLPIRLNMELLFTYFYYIDITDYESIGLKSLLISLLVACGVVFRFAYKEHKSLMSGKDEIIKKLSDNFADQLEKCNEELKVARREHHEDIKAFNSDYQQMHSDMMKGIESLERDYYDKRK